MVVSTSAAERIAQRYPQPRLPRWLVPVIVAVLALVAIVWLITTALRQATPPVAAEVISFDIVSAREAQFTMTVQRTDPSREVTCVLIAEAPNHERVGELLDLRVPPTEQTLVSVSGTIPTFREATSVSTSGCQLVD